jgi:tetratricopeptide (TPR) repeat protein
MSPSTPSHSLLAGLRSCHPVPMDTNLSIALPPQTRTAWRQAMNMFNRKATTNAILLLEDPFFLQVLEINIQGEPPVPIVAAFNRTTLCDAVSVLIHADNKKNTELRTLLVLTTDFNEKGFADCLRAIPLAYERTYYPGERNLALYRFFRITNAHPPDSPNNNVFEPFVNVIPAKREQLSSIITAKELKYLSDQDGGFWIRLGIVTALYQQQEFAKTAFYKAAQTSLHAALRLAVLADDLQCPLDSNQLASFALHAPDMEPCEALHAFMQTAYYTNNVSFVEALGNITPDCRESCIYKGIAAYKNEAYQEAASFFSRYENLVSTTPPEIIEAYGTALTETEQYEQAADLLQTGIELHPAYKWLYMRLGIAEAALGNHNAAVSALRVALVHSQDNAYILYLLINSLVALKEYEEAAFLATIPCCRRNRIRGCYGHGGAHSQVQDRIAQAGKYLKNLPI